MPPPLLLGPGSDRSPATQAPYHPRPVIGMDPVTGMPITGNPVGITTGATPEQTDAQAYIASFLREYGLESLSDWAWQRIIAGDSPTIIVQELYKRPEFRSRFPAYFARRDRGLAPMSPAQIVDYENRARQLFRQYGIPEGFWDTTEELQEFITNDLSLAELNDRIQLAAQIYFDTDQTAREELHRLYGISMTPGQEIAFILDEAKALPLIQRQVTAAAISATSRRTTYGPLSAAEAEDLYSLGVTPQQAAQGFSSLATQRELFAPLPGEEFAAGTISRAEQLAAQFGSNTVAQERIIRAAERRVAAFRGRTQFVESREGVLGLGTSNE